MSMGNRGFGKFLGLQSGRNGLRKTSRASHRPSSFYKVVMGTHHPSRASGALEALGGLGGSFGGTRDSDRGAEILTEGLDRGDLEGPLGRDLDGQLGGDLDGPLGGDLADQLGGDLDGPLEGDLDGTLGGDLGGDLDGDLDGPLDGDLDGTLGGDLDGTLGGDVDGPLGGEAQEPSGSPGTGSY